jgi:hypothetical protein
MRDSHLLPRVELFHMSNPVFIPARSVVFRDP